MENLRPGLTQRDKPTYTGLTRAGSARYEGLHLTGRSIAEGEHRPRGFSADDFNIFATMVFSFKDNREEFAAIRQRGDRVRHIDVGTGPNLYTFIASAPYVDEMIAVDLMPANIERLHETAAGVPVADHWQAWLEIGAILHDIGSADALIELDRRRSDIYDQLRNWTNLSDHDKEGIREYISDNTARSGNNPYEEINLQDEFRKKLKPVQGDIINDIAPLEQFSGTAHIVTENFLSESVTSEREIAAHVKTNTVQLARHDALMISAHISKTTGYNGFFSEEELAEDPTQELEELSATPNFFGTMVSRVVELTDTYRPLWERLEDGPENRKMVRPGPSYGSAVILVGRANYKHPDGRLKYNNGTELIEDIKDEVRMVTAIVPDDTDSPTTVFQRMHCVTDEVPAVTGALTGVIFEADPKKDHRINVSIAR